MEVPDLTIDQRLAELIELLQLTQQTVHGDVNVTKQSLGVIANNLRHIRRDNAKEMSVLKLKIQQMSENTTELYELLDEADDNISTLKRELSTLRLEKK